MEFTHLDTVHRVETPDGVDLNAELAGLGPRSLAFLIDFLIRLLVLLVMSVILGLTGAFGTGVLLLMAFVLEWFYPVYFEVAHNGQTPGKRNMGIQVVRSDLRPVDWLSSATRNLLLAADFLPLFYTFGICAMVCGRKFQRLGDLVAGTLVIYRQKSTQTPTIPDVVPVPPPAFLSPEDQLAVLRFTRRYQSLTTDRQIELANILSPITGKEGEPGVQALLSMGAWLAGHRADQPARAR